MALLSQYYPAPIVPGNQPGTFAAGNDPRIVGAAQKVGSDDIEITDSAKGIILQNQSGQRWKIAAGEEGLVYYPL